MARRLYLAVDVHDNMLAAPHRAIADALPGVFHALASPRDGARIAQLVAGSWDRISAAVVAGDPSRHDPETRSAPFHTLDVQVTGLNASTLDARRPRVEAVAVGRPRGPDGEILPNAQQTPSADGARVEWWHPIESMAPPPFGTRLTVEIHPHREDT
jgi:hypothetical protein